MKGHKGNWLTSHFVLRSVGRADGSLLCNKTRLRRAYAPSFQLDRIDSANTYLRAGAPARP